MSRFLSDVPLGESAVVGNVSVENRAFKRIRELGFFPNQHITAAFESPLGDPRVYRVFGTWIALRNEDAGKIAVDERKTS